MTNDTENLFLCLLAIIFGEQAVQIVYPFVNWVFKMIITGFEIFLIFYIEVLYQLCFSNVIRSVCMKCGWPRVPNTNSTAENFY